MLVSIEIDLAFL